jgi:hypothetical protein
MAAPQERMEETANPIEASLSEEKATGETLKKEEEIAGMELGTVGSKVSVDILPGGRLPGSNDDTRFVTSRKELWSYYAYYVGNNGGYFFFLETTTYRSLSAAKFCLAPIRSWAVQFWGKCVIFDQTERYSDSYSQTKLVTSCGTPQINGKSHLNSKIYYVSRGRLISGKTIIRH